MGRDSENVVLLHEPGRHRRERPMTAALEVVILPVSDPDKSLEFYRDKVGFTLDVDYTPATDFRVVQLTPPGSATSIQFGVGLTDAPPGSVQGIYLVVSDIVAVRDELIDRGVGVSSLRHKDVDEGEWRGRFHLGPDPHRADYASFAEFRDPDGNSWVLQERGHRDG
jgi:catechol 2,3-dioxygenase-like lactoylglutathione lyase family enzyme